MDIDAGRPARRRAFLARWVRLGSPRGWLALALVALAAIVSGLSLWSALRPRHAERTPFLVIGIDGAEWRVVRRMWREGELPTLKRLAAAGTAATLRTAYNASPVIWTTIATGVTPAEHGITDFVVPGPHGDVPISSAVRRVPALWTMLTRARRRVVVLGWWGSWPAEEVNGVVVSDRALLALPSRVFPREYLPKLMEDVERARALPYFDMNEEPELRDAVMASAARRLVGEEQRPDLLLLYFRSSDIVSHHRWKTFEAVEGSKAAHTDSDVQRVYRGIDAAIGTVLGAAGGPVNVMVISDHGFRAARQTEMLTQSNLDALLVRLGYQTRTALGVDLPRSRLYSYGSPNYLRKKMVRCSLAGRDPGGTLTEAQCEKERDRLERDLARVTFGGGEPVFLLRDPRAREQQAGADFIALLSSVGTSTRVLVDGQAVEDVVTMVSEIQGTHDSSNDGILIAAGPDIASRARLDGIGVHDITPTVLYGLGLPVAANFVGRAWTELYTADLRARQPLRTIPSWGTAHQGASRSSAADDKLMRELRSLGYMH